MNLLRIFFVCLLAIGFAMSASAGSITDSDGDLVPDVFDNCPGAPYPNGPNEDPNNQIDSDNDGFGNLCDADYNQSLGNVDFDDFDLFLGAFGGPGLNIFDHDFNGGTIDFDDFAVFLSLFGGPAGG